MYVGRKRPGPCARAFMFPVFDEHAHSWCTPKTADPFITNTSYIFEMRLFTCFSPTGRWPAANRQLEGKGCIGLHAQNKARTHA
jgi:hypothetical protein